MKSRIGSRSKLKGFQDVGRGGPLELDEILAV